MKTTSLVKCDEYNELVGGRKPCDNQSKFVSHYEVRVIESGWAPRSVISDLLSKKMGKTGSVGTFNSLGPMDTIPIPKGCKTSARKTGNKKNDKNVQHYLSWK